MRTSRKRSSTISGVPDRALSLEPSFEGGQVKVMVDRITKEHRSWNMSRIKNRNTLPEIAVRSMLHRLGLRFRLHRKDLPGSPDIVLPRFRTAVFVHGCFWHRHKGCRFAYQPKSRVLFWQSKFENNVKRDREKQSALRRLGWQVLVVWECELKSPSKLTKRLDLNFRK